MYIKLRNYFLLKLWNIKFLDIWYFVKIYRVKNLSTKEKSFRGIKRTVRLLSNFPGLWQRTIEQTPLGNCQWGGTLFVADGEADHYLILNSIQYPACSKLLPNIELPHPSRVWGLHMEPQDYVRLLGYDNPEEHSLTSRFYTNSEHLISLGGKYIASPPYVHFFTRKSLDFLMSVAPPKKTISLGIIASDINGLDGHKDRLRFLEEIDASDIDCAIWGRGDSLKRLRKYRGFALSKWDVHSKCRYSIVIENSVSQWYWSEKVSDSLLAYSLPLYHGCPSLENFLPKNSFIPININDSACIQVIRDILRKDPYIERLQAITLARKIILQNENIYAFINRELDLHDLTLK